MTPSARVEAAIALLTEIAAAPGAAADQIVANWFRQRRYVGSKDRRWVSELVWNVQRRRGELEWQLERAGYADALAPRALTFTALRVLAEISPEDTVELFGGPRGAGALSEEEVAAVGRLGADATEAPAWARGNFPRELEGQLRESLGDDFVAEVGALTGRAPIDLRVNTVRGARDAAQAALANEGIETAPTPYSPVGLRLVGRSNLATSQVIRAGRAEVQDEASQLAALLVGAQPGETVIDYCAGGGGKALAIAAAMNNRGRIIATDSNAARLAAAAPRVERAGATCIELRGDPASLTELADRVLVDAPCTGSGTWRRNPAAKWATTTATIDRYAATQAAILDSAAQRVRVGGRLIYVTCSLFRTENESQVEAFSARHPAYQVVPFGGIWRASVSDTPPSSTPMLRLTPRQHGTDGFFVAILERVR